jgi:hypothetical protein
MQRIILFLLCGLLLVTAGVSALPLETGDTYQIGDTITIRGDTNFNTDNNVLVEIFPASFGPASKYDSSMSGGGAVIVPVTQNETGYTWSAHLNSEGWSPDQYMVRVEVLGKEFRETGIITLTNDQIQIADRVIPEVTQVIQTIKSEDTPENRTRNLTATTTEQQAFSNLPKPSTIESSEQAIIPESTSLPAPVPTAKSPLSLIIVCGSLLVITGLWSQKK